MGKRGNGEGSISRRKDGLYMARYTVQTTMGSKRKTLYGNTRAEVSEKLPKAMADRDGGLVLVAPLTAIADPSKGLVCPHGRRPVGYRTVARHRRRGRGRGRGVPFPEEAQEGAERRSWWRRWFGFD